MQFTTLGSKSNPAVILIHGMMCTAKECEPFGKYLANDYYVIMPTLDGHGSDGTELLSVNEEIRKIMNYLKENNITSLELLQGSSMGAEVALAFLKLANDENFDIRCTFFDGGPFFKFPIFFRKFMRIVFNRMVKVFDTNNPEVAAERMMKNKFFDFVAKDKKEQYLPIIRSMAQERKTFSKKTIDNMVDICYNCNLPDLPKESQKRMVFFFSTQEPARDSKKRLKKTYPNAKYRDIKGYAHCGFQTKKPKAYARTLKKFIKECN